jgi:hypothetical protein
MYIKLGLIPEERVGDREQSAVRIFRLKRKEMEKITAAVMNFLNCYSAVVIKLA